MAEKDKTQPVIGTGISGVDSFLNRPLADTLRGVFSGPAPTGFGASQSPFATSQYSSGASSPPAEGLRVPFAGSSWLDLVGRNYSVAPQFPADIYDPLKGDPMTPRPPRQPFTTNAASISQADAIAQSNANMTPQDRAFYQDYMPRFERDQRMAGLSPSSQDVAGSVYRGAPSGIAGGVAPTTLSPSFDQGIASSRYNLAQSLNQTPMAPVSTNIAGATERKGIQTAYGMIYPADGQEAGAARSAALGPMGARYANVRQESNQADKIAQMRERGAAIGQSLVNRQESYFAQKQAERRALGAVESAARTAGASSMDVMRSRSAANKSPSSIGGIQQEFASYQPVVGPTAPTSLYASGAATRFTKSLPAGGFTSPRPSSMGLSGSDLYRQQQRDKMARGESGAFSNARSRQRRTTRGIARSQGIAPATNYSSQLDQEEYFRRRNLA